MAQEKLIDLLKKLVKAMKLNIKKQAQSNSNAENMIEPWQQITVWKDVIKHLTDLIEKYDKHPKELFLAQSLIHLDKYLDMYSPDLINYRKHLLISIVEKSSIIIQNNKIIKQKTCGKHEDRACEKRTPSLSLSKSPSSNLPLQAAVTFNAPYVFSVNLQKNLYLKIIRVIGKNNTPYGSYWLIGYWPSSRKIWRSRYAVLKSWNNGTDYVELNMQSIKQPITCWLGLAASQQVPFQQCILYGGWFQLWIDPKIITSLKKSNSISQRRPTGWK